MNANSIPSIDFMLSLEGGKGLAFNYGRKSVVKTLRRTTAEFRTKIVSGEIRSVTADIILKKCEEALEESSQPSLKKVINLTGTVLHTNFGRALLPRKTIEEVGDKYANPVTLEYDISRGKRGDRDDHIVGLIKELTNAEDATIVNNNAAAVFLTLNSLAQKGEVVVSRSELVEIGGSFRIPDIMRKAGCRLVEVGTTNRTHLEDFEDAITEKTAMVMRVHWSNFKITGFTASVDQEILADLCKKRKIPFIEDLGSGTLLEMEKFGLPREPTIQNSLIKGTDLVLFSCDKLLGGPQAGIIAGNKELIKKIKRNPLRRCLRVGKLTLCALDSVLRMYLKEETLIAELPTMRLLTKSVDSIKVQAERYFFLVQNALEPEFRVEMVNMKGQVGSGSLPEDKLPSFGYKISSNSKKNQRNSKITKLERSFRKLSIPIIGRIKEDSLFLDLRCLMDEEEFAKSFSELKSTDL